MFFDKTRTSNLLSRNLLLFLIQVFRLFTYHVSEFVCECVLCDKYHRSLSRGLPRGRFLPIIIITGSSFPRRRRRSSRFSHLTAITQTCRRGTRLVVRSGGCDACVCDQQVGSTLERSLTSDGNRYSLSLQGTAIFL